MHTIPEFELQPKEITITITNDAAWSIEFQTNGGYFDTRKKTLTV